MRGVLPAADRVQHPHAGRDGAGGGTAACAPPCGRLRRIADRPERLAGEDVAKILYKNFRGQQVVFPNKLYSSNFTAQKIREEYNGKNAKELALKYGFTERWVRTILKSTK